MGGTALLTVEVVLRRLLVGESLVAGFEEVRGGGETTADWAETAARAAAAPGGRTFSGRCEPGARSLLLLAEAECDDSATPDGRLAARAAAAARLDAPEGALVRVAVAVFSAENLLVGGMTCCFRELLLLPWLSLPLAVGIGGSGTVGGGVGVAGGVSFGGGVGGGSPEPIRVRDGRVDVVVVGGARLMFAEGPDTALTLWSACGKGVVLIPVGICLLLV